MKRFLIFLILWLPFLLAIGQTLPVVVDNSHYFPPVIDQQGPSCTHVSLIYYLKSAIWNRQFNRDPKLPENQFSYGFVWGQNRDPLYDVSDPIVATHFMRYQGCATVSHYPLDWNSAGKPSFDIREKALRYKSKQVIQSDFLKFAGNPQAIAGGITELKKKLNQGDNFVMGFYVFEHFKELTSQNIVYNAYPGLDYNDILYNHMVVIVGYNDTIKTVNGRGAFLAIDSSSKLPGGKFLLDYGWFNLFANPFPYYFLEEDFSSHPEVSIILKVNDAVKSSDVLDRKYFFVEKTVDNAGKKYDFIDDISYFSNRNSVRISSINGKEISPPEYHFIFPLFNTNGDYELLADLTGVINEDDFESLSVLVLDPTSALYKDESGNNLYSYARSSFSSFAAGNIHFLSSGKRFSAKVTNLSDTTFLVTDFYSNQVGWHMTPYQSDVFIKSCTSTVKRKLVTFSVDYVDNPPEFTNKPAGNVLSTDVGTTVKFQFTASDPENQTLSFSIIQGQRAQISSTGLFSYYPNAAGDYDFTVRVSDGINYDDYSFVVKASINQPPVFTSVPEGGIINVRVPEKTTFQFVASDPEGKAISYSLISLYCEGFIDANGLFSYQSWAEGVCPFIVKASDGKNVTEYSFNVQITAPPVNHPPRFDYASGNVFISLRDTFTFAFRAIDQDGHTITYSLAAGSPGTINPTTGEFSFVGTQLGIFTITVVISDGQATAEYSFVIQVDIPDAVEGIEDSGFSFSAYPNPVNSQLNLEFSLPVSGHVLIEIIDISGRVFGTITEGVYRSGTNTLNYDTSYLRNGEYICLLKFGQLVRTLKLTKK